MTALLCIIYLAFISLGLPDTLLGSAWPVMRTDLSAAFAVAGYLAMCVQAGTVFSSLYSGRLIARFGTAQVTLVSVVMTALALFGISFTPNVVFLFVCAIPLGLGAGSVDAALNNFVARHYESRHMNWLHCFWGIGATIGPAIMSLTLVKPEGWRTGYLIIASLQTLLVLTLSGSLSLWKKAPERPEEGKPSSVIGNRQALKIPCVKLALISFVFYCAAEATIGLWSSSYLVMVRGFSAPDAARTASFFYAAITAGRFVSGVVSMRVASEMLIRLGQITCAVGAILFLLPSSAFLPRVGIILLGLGLAPIFPSMLHETPRRFGEVSSQAVMGLQMAFAYIGATCFPPLFGALATWSTIRIFPGFVLGCILILFLASERLNGRLSVLWKSERDSKKLVPGI